MIGPKKNQNKVKQLEVGGVMLLEELLKKNI